MTFRAGSVDSFWEGVPDTEVPAPAGTPGLTRLAKVPPSRRTALKGTIALGGALAFNVLGAMPASWLTRAAAVAGTEWTGDPCAGYSAVPGYNDNTQICVGAIYSSSYCGTDGWFLSYTSSSFKSWPVKACGTGAYRPQRNAWRWPYGGRWYRCADGNQQVTGQSAVFRICSRQLN